jgi:hypothetical protein
MASASARTDAPAATMMIRATTLANQTVSDSEFLYQAGRAARHQISEWLRSASRLHSIHVIKQPNAYRIHVVTSGANGTSVAEACVAAEDGFYRLSVRSPKLFRVAECGESIFHEICNEESLAVAEWLTSQIKESLS